MSKYFVVLLVCSLFFTACKKENVELKSTSSDNKATVIVTAQRGSSMEPWQVELKVQTPVLIKDGALKFEVQNSELSTKTVLINWTDNNHCTIEFLQPDGENKKFELLTTDTETLLQPVL